MLLLRILPHDDFVHAHLSGLVSVEAWAQVLRELEHAVSEAAGARLVMDLTALVGWLGVPERTAVGALMAIHLARMERVAAYIQAEKIAGVVQGEACRNGLNLRLFPTFDEAARWVLA